MFEGNGVWEVLSLPSLPPLNPRHRCQLGTQAVTQHWSHFYCSHATPVSSYHKTRTPVDTLLPLTHDIHQVPADSQSLVFVTILNNLLPPVRITKQASGAVMRLTRANHQRPASSPWNQDSPGRPYQKTSSGVRTPNSEDFTETPMEDLSCSRTPMKDFTRHSKQETTVP